MSHEIRTPMNGIIGMVEMLVKNTQLDKLQKEYLEIVHRSSLDLLTILNDILDLSKLEGGKMRLQLQEVNIHDIIHNLMGLFSAAVKQKGMHIRSIYSDDLPDNFKADGARVKQIVANLLGNAFKFSEEGEIVIKTSLVEQNKDELKIKIEIIDTGAGIAKEDQKKLFSQFQQLNQSSTKAIKGTGLGLAICKKLVALLGGEIGVISEAGKGSNFWFTFNAFPLTEKEKEKEKEKEDTQFDIKVLLVDDIQVNLTVVELMLVHLGCEVTVAKNGKEALEQFKEEGFDLVLMDIQMPVMGGVEATQTIKKNNRNVPPIIGLSANAMSGDAEKYMEQGLDDYLHKPINLDVLSNKLATWFESDGTRKAMNTK